MRTTRSPGPAAARTISVRRPDLDHAEPELPKYFVAGDPARSHLSAMLSAVFPEGEDFFVRSVRAYRDQIDDPELAKQVKGFIGQEALHGREHREFNERLAELGYPTRFVDRRLKAGLALLHKVAPKNVQLAVTAALEHYTATLAEVLLTDESARAEFLTDDVRTLYTWHALEETEHKAVAFDVFQHVSGNHVVRVGTMAAVHVLFALEIGLAMLLSFALDPGSRKVGRLARSVWALRRHPLFGKRVRQRLRDYNRRDFHPDDHDTEALLAEWREWWEHTNTAA